MGKIDRKRMKLSKCSYDFNLTSMLSDKMKILIKHKDDYIDYIKGIIVCIFLILITWLCFGIENKELVQFGLTYLGLIGIVLDIKKSTNTHKEFINFKKEMTQGVVNEMQNNFEHNNISPTLNILNSQPVYKDEGIISTVLHELTENYVSVKRIYDINTYPNIEKIYKNDKFIKNVISCDKKYLSQNQINIDNIVDIIPLNTKMITMDKKDSNIVIGIKYIFKEQKIVIPKPNKITHDVVNDKYIIGLYFDDKYNETVQNIISNHQAIFMDYIDSIINFKKIKNKSTEFESMSSDTKNSIHFTFKLQ